MLFGLDRFGRIERSARRLKPLSQIVEPESYFSTYLYWNRGYLIVNSSVTHMCPSVHFIGQLYSVQDPNSFKLPIT